MTEQHERPPRNGRERQRQGRSRQARSPQARARGLPDHHNPMGGVGGAAPALSPLTLRFVLAIVGFVAALAGAIVLAIVHAPMGFVIAFAVVALTAAVDIVVVTRRKRRGEPG